MTKNELGPKEQKLVAYFIKYLTLNGWTVWRNNTITGRLEDSSRFIHNGLKGSPDIIGFWPCLRDCEHKKCGVFIGIEVKREGKNYLSFYQKIFAKKVRETKNGVYIVARKIEDIWEQLEDYKKEPLPF